MKTLLALALATLLIAPPTPNFKLQVIDNQIDIGYGLAIGDVDGDRKPDILLADQKEIVWYRNDGDGPWQRFVMAANLTPRDNVCIAARDIDGDGKVEVAVGAQWDPGETSDAAKSGAVFYLIRPTDPTQRWEPVQLHHEPTTHRMRWAKVGNRYLLIVVPLHGRGNRNGEGRGVQVLAYHPPQDVRTPWTYELVDSTMHLTHNFEIWEDADGTRLLLGGKEGSKVLANRGGKWVPEPRWIGEGVPVGEVRRGTLPNGTPFVAAVEPMHGNQLVVFKNGTKQVLYTQLNQGHGVVCGDFLGVGSSQVAVGWRAGNAARQMGVRLFVPDAKGETWTEHAVDDSVLMACEDLQAADLNGDGKLDLVASGRASLNLIVYWNQRR